LYASFSLHAQEVAVKEKSKITGNIELNYRQKYLWRGSAFGSFYVSQPEINLEYKNFRLSLSSYFNTKPSILSEALYTKKTFFEEQDVEIGYVKTVGKWEFEFWLLNYFYFFQIGQPNVTELSATVRYHKNDNLNFFTENVVGLRGYPKGFYSYNGIEYTHNLSQNSSLVYTVHTGLGNTIYNGAYFSLDKAALTYFGGILNYEKAFKKGLYVFGNVEANYYPNKLVRAATALNGVANYSIGLGKKF
jgi:hypothetical protein